MLLKLGVFIGLVDHHQTYNARNFNQNWFQSPKDCVNDLVHKYLLFLNQLAVSQANYSFLVLDDAWDEILMEEPLDLLDCLYGSRKVQIYFHACRVEFLFQSCCTKEIEGQRPNLEVPNFSFILSFDKVWIRFSFRSHYHYYSLLSSSEDWEFLPTIFDLKLVAEITRNY